jgi:hypothetical protein
MVMAALRGDAVALSERSEGAANISATPSSASSTTAKLLARLRGS